MGEASRRGTRDERVAAAIKRREDAEKAQREARERRERERDAEVARQWALLTPEERTARLERAKAEVALHAEFAQTMGHDAATVLLDTLHAAENRRRKA